MNYEKIYNDLILKAKSENRKKTKTTLGELENHHITPKCLNGNDLRENKVLLTTKEHFIAHKLLVEIYPESRKLIFALWRMSNMGSKNQKRNYIVTAREYERIKKCHALCASKTLSGIKRKPLSEETKLKIQKAKIKNGTNIPSKETIKKMLETRKRKGLNKHSQKTKDKIGLANKGKERSEEFKNYLSEINKGKRLSKETVEKFKNRRASQETKLKMSKTRKGKKLSKEWCNNISNGRKGIKFSEDHIKSLRKAKLGVKRPKHIGENHSKKMKGYKYEEKQCPYCKFYFPINVIKRYHFENCKLNLSKNEN